MGIILGIFLVFAIIMLIIGVLIVLALIMGVGLIIGMFVAYVKAAIIYISSVIENIDSLAMRIFMITVTCIIAGGPLLITLIGILSSL